MSFEIQSVQQQSNLKELLHTERTEGCKVAHCNGSGIFLKIKLRGKSNFQLITSEA